MVTQKERERKLIQTLSKTNDVNSDEDYVVQSNETEFGVFKTWKFSME